MAITKKFLCYQTNNAFLSDLNNNQISNESIVFVIDKKFIYTHGNYFYGDLKADDLNDTEYVIANALAEIDSRIREIVSNNQESETTINGNIEDINESIENIESDIEELSQSVETLENDLDDTERIVSSSLTDLDSRINSITQNNQGLEKIVYGNVENIKSIDDSVKEVKNDVEELEENLDQSIENLESDLSKKEYIVTNALVDLDSRIKDVISDNKSLESTINNKLNQKADNKDSVEYIVGTQVNSTNSWTGVTKSSYLYSGKKIIYWLPTNNELITTENTYVTLSITLSSGNGNTITSNILKDSKTNFNRAIPANTPIPLVYKNNSWYLLRDLENDATTTSSGLMSPEDKAKLDSFDNGEEYTKNEVVEDIELTISAALSDLDRRLIILSSKVTLLEQATDNNLDVISTSLNDIISDINDIKSQLNS